jgi:hypothetical protein
VDPCDPDAITFLEAPHVRSQDGDAANDLMARNHGVARRDEPTFDEIEIRSADTAHAHAHDEIAAIGLGARNVRGFQGRRPACHRLWLS